MASTSQNLRQASGRYLLGYGLSLGLTLTSFGLVWLQTNGGQTGLSRNSLVLLLVVLAVSQLVVQLVCFLHVGGDKKRRWNLLALLFAVMVVLIVAIGSLWIMANLNYNMMPSEMDQFMREQAQKGF